jgi:hypothetical protein
MKKLILSLIVGLAAASAVSAQLPPPVTVLKPTLSIRAARDLGYWKMPEAKNYWSWMPQVAFTMTGPVEDASFLTFEFTTPDGKPWYSWDTAPFSIAMGATRGFESQAVANWWDKRSTVLTGTFGFKVTLKNNLNGTSKELYKGAFKANKKFAGTPHPDFKNQWAYYVEQDWALPIGYVNLDWAQDVNSPSLYSAMWFRGEFDSLNLNAFLFYNGKQISSTKTGGNGTASSIKAIIHNGAHELRWDMWKFSFFNVRSADAAGSFPDAFLLNKNPGNYEIKVLLDGELVRTAAFAVGADGKIVDNGVAANNGFAGFGTVIPVRVIPAKEKISMPGAWKTDAFYGNPLTGFSAQ